MATSSTAGGIATCDQRRRDGFGVVKIKVKSSQVKTMNSQQNCGQERWSIKVNQDVGWFARVRAQLPHHLQGRDGYIHHTSRIGRPSSPGEYQGAFGNLPDETFRYTGHSPRSDPFNLDVKPHSPSSSRRTSPCSSPLSTARSFPVFEVARQRPLTSTSREDFGWYEPSCFQSLLLLIFSFLMPPLA
jgi:hypothetical protein